jgi:hypothetical protein
MLQMGDTGALVAYQGTGSQRTMVALLIADFAVWGAAVAMLVGYGV